MNAKEYRQKTRKSITCPSGLELEVRKIRALDFLKFGLLPDVLSKLDKDPNKADPAIIEKMQKMYLTQMVIGKDDFRIVDKEPMEELAENEISYLDISDVDVRFIIDEVVKFSSDETEAGGKIDTKPFRKKSVSGDA